MLDRFFLYFPERNLISRPDQTGIDYEEVSITAADGVRLHGWLVPGRRDVVWIWFHGNAGHIGHRLDNLWLLHRNVGPTVLLFDYRGYGRSDGKPSERGLYVDAQAALDFVRSHEATRGKRVVYFGRSLGSAVAVDLALRSPPDGLILESPFMSTVEMAKRFYRFIPSPLVRLLIRSRLDTASKIPGVNAPLLILHGDRDPVVPIDAGRELYNRANQPKRFARIRGAGHNDTYAVGGDGYWKALSDFLDSVS